MSATASLSDSYETDSEHLQYDDGRVELREAAAATLEKSPIFNHDLAPTSVKQRTWTTYTFAALWISMAHCIPTYRLAAGLVDPKVGMNWWQAILTILIGNLIVLAPILLNSHAGTKYGIPFPVFARAAYGTYGANLPAVMRALVACGWFGINAWIGGQALQTFFRVLWSGWPTVFGDGQIGGHLATEWISFAIFWAINILIVIRGMELLRKVENLAAPFVLVMTALLLAWAIKKAYDVGGSLGPIMSGADHFKTTGAFWKVFAPSVTAMVGFWATLSLNMPDFTRFGRSQREQMVGQVVALPTTMTVFAAMGVMITSASAVIYGTAMWDPVELVGKFPSRLLVGIAMFTVVVATLSVNIAANVVSPANDFANLAPKKITFKMGGIATGVIGVLMFPWKLMADPRGYIFDWLVGYSGGLGSIAGVLVCDYWLVRQKRLVLADLYRPDGTYPRVSWAGVVATLVGCFLAWIGLVVPFLRPMFDYAWFVGALGSGLTYWVWKRAEKK
jgi:NCS1 family nucleobase:cation symporter-1